LAAKNNLVGIDIGSSSVKMVELKPKKKGYVVKSAVSMPLLPDIIVEGSIIDYSEVTKAVVDGFKEGKFSAKNVATALKGNDVITKKVNVPVTDPNELQETFMYEAEQYIQMDIDEVSIDYEILEINDASGQSTVLMAVARKDLINDVLSVLQSAKLKPVVVDLEVFTLMNIFENNYIPGEDLDVIINIGHSKTLFTFLTGGEYEFSREVSKGGKELNEKIEKALTVTMEEAENLKKDSEAIGEKAELAAVIDEFCQQLSTEINTTLDMIAGGSQMKIGRCFICGGTSMLKGLREKLHEVLDADIEFLDPFSGMEISGNISGDDYESFASQYAVAAGLALRGIKEK